MDTQVSNLMWVLLHFGRNRICKCNLVFSGLSVYDVDDAVHHQQQS